METIILSVPFRSQSETLKNIKGSLRPGQLLIERRVPLAAAVSGRATRGVSAGSAAQAALDGARQLEGRLRSARSPPPLTDLDHDLAQDVLVCGEEREDKRRAALLLQRIEGLLCVDCGRLEMARVAESMTALMISINAKHKCRTAQSPACPTTTWD